MVHYHITLLIIQCEVKMTYVTHSYEDIVLIYIGLVVSVGRQSIITTSIKLMLIKLREIM